MREKIKPKWKRILIIGASGYVTIAIISAVAVAVFIKSRMEKIENCEDEIGKAFVERKADFRENFSKNWDAARDSLIEAFKGTEKISDKHQLDLLKSIQKDAQERLSGSGMLYIKNRSEEERLKLGKKLQERAELIASAEVAFKKKWFSQKDNETLEEFLRRQDEGGIDWQAEYIAKHEWLMAKEIMDEYEVEDSQQHLKEEKAHLTYLQEKFQEKYGEPYDGTEFREVCVVLQEQALKETQEFMDKLAAKQAAEEQKKDLSPIVIAKNFVICAEKEQTRFSEEKSYLSLRHLHELLAFYADYNRMVAAFEEKWGIEVEEPLKARKEELGKMSSWAPTFWGFLPVDYLAKEKELEALLPKLELEFDTQFIADLRERIPQEEKVLDKWKSGWLTSEEEQVKKEKAALKKRNLRPSLLSLEEGFEKKWTPKKKEETAEQFERRQSEGNIQFLSAFIENLNTSRLTLYLGIEKSDLNMKTTSSAEEALRQAEKEFFGQFKEVCPEGQRKEFLPMEIARDAVIRAENEQWISPEKSYRGLRHLHELLAFYAEYNGLVAAFEEKWEIEAEEPLRAFKEASDIKWRREKVVDWGFLPVDYLAKAKELEALLPKIELEFDTQFISSFQERVADQEKIMENEQQEFDNFLKKNRFFGNRDKILRKELEFEAKKSNFKYLNLRPSLLSLEEAFAKKRTPKKEEETIEQFERRESEGNIQFLSALIERMELDRESVYPFLEALSPAEESFFVKYGEVCPQVNIATD